MSPDKIVLSQKLEQVTEYWNPAIAGQLNGQDIRLVKLKGEFVWHKHDAEDEMFLVLFGQLEMQFRDKTVVLNAGECIIIPRGTEHRPVSPDECHVLLFEPSSTINTGDKITGLTRNRLNRV